MKNKTLMRRIASLCLVILMVLGCCACNGTATVTPVTPGNEGAQYVIALNPSVAYEDGTVNSIRNTTASAMQQDISAEKPTALYDSNWRLGVHNAETAELEVRLLRGLVNWRDASGATVNNAPYAYTLTDSGITSLSVYDVTKMDIKGVNDDELPKSGVILAFTGDKEEAIAFTADRDCVLKLSDQSMSNIAIVDSIYGVKTNFTAVEGAKKAIVVRIYKNSRIYWQEVLDASSTSVVFPEFSDLELKTGDTVMVTATAVDDTSAVIRGNCDLPARTATVTNKIPVETIVVDDSDDSGVGFTDKNGDFVYTIVRPQSNSSKFGDTVTKLVSGIRNNMGLTATYELDNIDVTGPRILLYNANEDNTQAAYNQVKKDRARNAADFIIRVEGQDIIITAATELGMDIAVDFFLNNYAKDINSKIPADLNYVSSKFNANKDVTLAGISISKYRLVVSRVASYMTTLAADELIKDIAKLTGYQLSVVRDGEHSTRQDYEISVGDTDIANFDGVADYTNNPDSDGTFEYKIKVNAKNTTILGSTVAAVNSATVGFVKLLSEKITLAKNFTFEDKYDGGYSLTNGYKFTWGDDFNGTKLAGYWAVDSHLGNVRENQFGGMTRNIKPVVKDGELQLITTKTGNNVTSTELQSTGANTMNFMWGYLEARVKMSKSVGIAECFWTKAPVAGGFLECDINENFGNPARIKHNLHTWEDSGHVNILGGRGDTLNNAEGTSSLTPFGNEYHTIGWLWTDDYTKFFIDGQETLHFDSVQSKYDIFNKPAWLLVSADICSPDYGAQPDKNFVTDTTYYDYIHVYQQDNGSVMYIKN